MACQGAEVVDEFLLPSSCPACHGEKQELPRLKDDAHSSPDALPGNSEVSGVGNDSSIGRNRQRAEVRNPSPAGHFHVGRINSPYGLPGPPKFRVQPPKPSAWTVYELKSLQQPRHLSRGEPIAELAINNPDIAALFCGNRVGRDFYDLPLVVAQP